MGGLASIDLGQLTPREFGVKARQHRHGGLLMPSSAVRTFADPDEFASSVRQGSVELTVTGNETFSTELVRIDLHRMWMQHFSETTPRIMHVSDWGGRTAISFQTQPGPPLVRCGIDVPPDAITRHDAVNEREQQGPVTHRCREFDQRPWNAMAPEVS